MDKQIVTPRSVAEAKSHQQAERERVFEQTGLRILDTPIGAPLTIVHCRQPGCPYKATAKREMQAINSLSAHIVRAHLRLA